jgi:hypothetical protein
MAGVGFWRRLPAGTKGDRKKREWQGDAGRASGRSLVRASDANRSGRHAEGLVRSAGAVGGEPCARGRMAEGGRDHRVPWPVNFGQAPGKSQPLVALKTARKWRQPSVQLGRRTLAAREAAHRWRLARPLLPRDCDPALASRRQARGSRGGAPGSWQGNHLPRRRQCIGAGGTVIATGKANTCCERGGVSVRASRGRLSRG